VCTKESKEKITNYLKTTLAKRATVGPKRYMTPAALNAEDRIFFVLDKDHLPA
jgi:hypothetical protein